MRPLCDLRNCRDRQGPTSELEQPLGRLLCARDPAALGRGLNAPECHPCAWTAPEHLQRRRRPCRLEAPPGAAPRTPRDLSPEPAGVQAAVPYVRLATQRKAPRPCQVGRCLDVKAAQYLRTGIDLSVTLSLGKGRL